MINTSNESILPVAELFPNASVTLGVGRGGSNQEPAVSTRQRFKWLVWAMSVATFFFISVVTDAAVARASEQKNGKTKTEQSFKRAQARPTSEAPSTGSSRSTRNMSNKVKVTNGQSTQRSPSGASVQKSPKRKGPQPVATDRSRKRRTVVASSTPRKENRFHALKKTESSKPRGLAKRS
jgi:hypothetical protein